MKASWKSLLFVVTIIIIGGLFFTFLYGQRKELEARKTGHDDGVVAGASTEENNYSDKMAKFLRDKGMVLFGSYQSDDLQEQKKFFGDSAKYLDYVECDSTGPNANPDECIANKIEIYPTWVYQGKSYEGVKSLAELAQIVGFSE